MRDPLVVVAVVHMHACALGMIAIYWSNLSTLTNQCMQTMLDNTIQGRYMLEIYSEQPQSTITGAAIESCSMQKTYLKPLWL